jgi:hypothetical protein
VQTSYTFCNVCREASLPPRKLKTLVKTKFASKVILFQETLEYPRATTICYNHQSLHLQAYVSFGPTWAIARAMIETLNLIIKQCVLN